MNSKTENKGGSMEEKLSKEEVMHVAELAKIKINEKDLEKYQIELKKLLKDVEKIREIKGYDEEFLITPTEEVCILRNDEEESMLTAEEVLKNVPCHNGNYIEVPVVINE